MGSDFKFLFVYFLELLCIIFFGRKEYSLWYVVLFIVLINSEVFILVVFLLFLLFWILVIVLGFFSMWCRVLKDLLFGVGEVRFKIINDK